MSPYYITIELGGFKVKFGSFLGKIQLHLTGRTSKITERQKNTSNEQRSSSIFFIITQNPVSVSLFVITYRKYSEFIKKMGCCSVFQRWLSLFLYMVGLIISGYSYYVHIAKKADENYVALCDIDETISCSKVFTSKYGKGSNLRYYIF